MPSLPSCVIVDLEHPAILCQLSQMRLDLTGIALYHDVAARVRGALEFGGLAGHVLRVFDTVNEFVEPRTSVAAGHLQRQPEVLTGGFETAHGEVAQAHDVTLQRFIRYAVLLGHSGFNELVQRKMRRKLL